MMAKIIAIDSVLLHLFMKFCFYRVVGFTVSQRPPATILINKANYFFPLSYHPPLG